ncbi:hypothetical protein RA307_20590 [Xanthobacteraceae bacterium Astr-EGSB]|uniref:hypothetical protein n=1 Tax=Astrobacterium formosum TaxID=3069710 RepID=UPI0027B5D74C|nr:hypothetical protein [Xanthobacteraceae bacterium Astr-EGSB]
MLLFRTFLLVDAVAAAVIVYFFVVGVDDGSVSSFNAGVWAATLAGVTAVLVSGWRLNAAGKSGLATALLAIMALPALAFGLFVLLLVVTQPNWN